tara:strand:+ start:38 stop:985 length:948 start_codon:yes stop_codon:yes gene_type:complete
MSKKPNKVQTSMFSYLVNKKLNVFNLCKKGKTNWKTDINKSIVVKQIKRPRLITFTSDIELEDISNYGRREFNYQKISLLKSNIQKAVRRNIPDVAISSACELIKFKSGLTQFLRRLCIIIIEDKFNCYKNIANHYNTLVWMMATEKGWNGWINWVLGLLYFICNKKYEYVNHTNDINYIWSDNQYSCALLLRVFYGGMKGDMILLKNSAKIIEKINENELDSNTVEFDNIKPNYDLKIIKSSVDFHCVPGIIKNILNKHSNYTADNIKKAIWDYSSSKRFDCKNKEPNNLWKDVRKTVINFQRWYISNLSYKEF